MILERDKLLKKQKDSLRKKLKQLYQKHDAKKEIVPNNRVITDIFDEAQNNNQK